MKRIFLVFLILILASCKESSVPGETLTPNGCSAANLSRFITTMDNAVQQFEDITSTAKETPVENLESIIKKMEEAKQGLENIDTPSCAIETKAALDSYMFSTIQCNFGLYAAEQKMDVEKTPLPDDKIDSCTLAPDQLDYYNTQMDELKAMLSEMR